MNIEKIIAEKEFHNYIVSKLENNPEWHRTALEAITLGMDSAYRKLKEDYVKKDFALLASLSLIKSNPVSKSLRETLLPVIKKGIHPKDSAPVVKEFLNSVDIVED